MKPKFCIDHVDFIPSPCAIFATDEEILNQIITGNDLDYDLIKKIEEEMSGVNDEFECYLTEFPNYTFEDIPKLIEHISKKYNLEYDERIKECAFS